MKKIVVDYCETGSNILGSSGGIIGFYNPADVVEFKGDDEKSNIALELVKQGVTVDEIIKLKNADLL